MRRRTFFLSGLAALMVSTQAAALSVYVAEDGQVLGPFDEAALKAQLGSQTKASVTLVWMQGMTDWTPASQVPALAVLVGRLPLDPPFDVAKHLIGAWISDDQPLGKGKEAFVGKMSIVFAADRTFTALVTGNRTTVTVTPSGKPRQPIVTPEFLSWNSSFAGDYTVTLGNDGYFSVELKGTVTHNGSNSQDPIKAEQTIDFRQLGPDHMVTRYGVDYRRTAN